MTRPSVEDALPAATPTAFTVLGILNICFGSLGFCCGTGMIPLFTVGPDSDFVQGSPLAEMMRLSGAYRGFLKIGVVLDLVGSLFLIIAGVALLKGLAWGRLASLVYAGYALAWYLVSLGLHGMFLLPPLWNELGQPLGRRDLELLSLAAFEVAGMLIGFCMGIAYAIILLVVLRKPFVSRPPVSTV